jgi:ATP-dependent Clp protease ATP-binding subunit ClpC
VHNKEQACSFFFSGGFLGGSAMYEGFTNRARRVLQQLAVEEAQRLNHEYIGTEHILLGLAKDDGGVAAMVLKNFDVDFRKIRLEVEGRVESGPEMVTRGNLPQTPRAKAVIRYSIEEARGLNHSYVGTEHILLGLLREADGVACEVLTNLGLKLDDVRAEVLKVLGHGRNDDQISEETPLLNRSKSHEERVLDALLSEASKDSPVRNSLLSALRVILAVHTVQKLIDGR